MTATILSPGNPGVDQPQRAGAAESAPGKRKDPSRDGADSAPFDAIYRSFAATVSQVPMFVEPVRTTGQASAAAPDNTKKPADEAHTATSASADRAATAPKLRLISRAGETARGELGLAAHADPTRAATDRLMAGATTPSELAREASPVDDAGTAKSSAKSGDAPATGTSGDARGSSARTSSDRQPDASPDQRQQGQGQPSQGAAPQRAAADASRGSSNETAGRDPRAGGAASSAKAAQPAPAAGPAPSEQASVKLSVSPTGKLQSAPAPSNSIGVAAAGGGAKATDPLKLIKPAPPPTTSGSRELIESQVAKALGNAIQRKDGVASLRLTPEHLGEVRVEVRVKDGIVAARLDVTTDQARALLDDAVHGLRSALEARGLHVDKVEVRHVTDDRSHAMDGGRPDSGDAPADAGGSQDGSNGSPWMGRPGSGDAGGAGGSEDRGVDAAEAAADGRDGSVDGLGPVGLAWDAESSMWRSGVDAVV